MIVAQPNGNFEARLVHINRPIMRIPTLAIHLNRDVNDKGFCFNKQTHLLPVIATAVASQLGNKKASEPDAAAPAFAELHHSVLVELIAAELGVPPEDVRDFELSLCDTQPAALGGVYNEFIFSRALDNLMMSFISTQALITSSKDLAEETMIRIVGLYDHEGQERNMAWLRRSVPLGLDQCCGALSVPHTVLFFHVSFFLLLECGSASIMGAGSNNLYQRTLPLLPEPSRPRPRLHGDALGSSLTPSSLSLRGCSFLRFSLQC